MNSTHFFLADIIVKLSLKESTPSFASQFGIEVAVEGGH